MDNQDLKYIKKHYGENFAKLCRELFPTILETPGLLAKIITEKFDSTPTLYEDMLPVKNQFKNYLYSFIYTDKKEESVQQSPEELFDEAGYILYPECETEEDIQKFRKYWKSSEELCTFYDGRLNSCRVWFAVKKNVDEIKRENFNNPKRQDEYGTSVISIQFTHGSKSTLSIKNRYNHAVLNPDATFSNDLDNIKCGLTEAFCKKYRINLINQYENNLEIPGYVLANNGKMYKSNVENHNINFCANNIVVGSNGKAIKYDKSKYMLIDNYLIDFRNKKIIASSQDKHDAFVNSIGEIKSIIVTIDENKNRVIDITPESGENVQIVTNQSNQILKYTNPNVKVIGDNFLSFSKAVKEIDLPNVETIGFNFLLNNEDLIKINVQNIKKVGDFTL